MVKLADVLTEKRWIKERWITETSWGNMPQSLESPYKCCLLGGHDIYEKFNGFTRTDDDTYCRLIGIMQEYVRENPKYNKKVMPHTGGMFRTLSSFNDNQLTTWADVQEVIRRFDEVYSNTQSA